jgi:hypothetical protein
MDDLKFTSTTNSSSYPIGGSWFSDISSSARGRLLEDSALFDTVDALALCNKADVRLDEVNMSIT